MTADPLPDDPYYDDPSNGPGSGGGLLLIDFGGDGGNGPQKPQSPNTLNCFKNQAFPQAFGSNAQISPTELVNNGNPIGGHVNFSFQATFSGPEQQAAFNNVLQQNTLVPPGARIGVTINGQSDFGLHVEQVTSGANATVPTVNFIAHLDAGDPNSDLFGALKHVIVDFFKGHRPGANLDPKCN